MNGSRSAVSVSSFWFAPVTMPSDETMPKPFGIQTCPAMSFASMLESPRNQRLRVKSLGATFGLGPKAAFLRHFVEITTKAQRFVPARVHSSRGNNRA